MTFLVQKAEITLFLWFVANHKIQKVQKISTWIYFPQSPKQYFNIYHEGSRSCLKPAFIFISVNTSSAMTTKSASPQMSPRIRFALFRLPSFFFFGVMSVFSSSMVARCEKIKLSLSAMLRHPHWPQTGQSKFLYRGPPNCATHFSGLEYFSGTWNISLVNQSVDLCFIDSK